MYTHIGQLDSEQQRAWREYWFVNRAECLHHCLFGSLVQVLEFDNRWTSEAGATMAPAVGIAYC